MTSQKRPHDLEYAKDLLYNVAFYTHSYVVGDLFAQYHECRDYYEREDWFWRTEATLDMEQFGRVRSEEERYG